MDVLRAIKWFRCFQIKLSWGVALGFINVAFPGALPQALLMSPRWGFPGALPQALLMDYLVAVFGFVLKATTGISYADFQFVIIMD
ncbi:MAG: hypothetical protein DRR08_25470 [Candidatus Parabeggiatoa sp. nov. 2]|nr:MAG: hypothetical protein DRR08_25470 [Gammaproteobacteria bacterium]